jgi:hypothetical protein
LRFAPKGGRGEFEIERCLLTFDGWCVLNTTIDFSPLPVIPPPLCDDDDDDDDVDRC